jgi:photosystem II stability/assembly factor-like uncharacterized protein
MAVHPKNPDVIYVAALGHAFGPNEERGVYRSKDGGKTWDKVLYKNEGAGAIDISIDELNPEIVYASMWQAHRNFWELSSGGPDSGLWMSRDGGDTWSDISKNKGLEKLGLLGKIGVSASPVQAGRVWALIEAKDKPGLYRSDDFGDTWQLVCDEGKLRRRPWYYMHVHADPADADTVYVNNLGFYKSTDGGKTFTEIATPHGDNHGLWIDPKNNRRMIQGNDGGANVSFNGGETFSSIYNQLTGQYYQMDVDNQFPYRLYATQQDNSSISVPSDTAGGAISWGDCYVAGTGESGYIAVKPDDANTVIVGAVGSSPGGLGALQKYDRRTGQIQLINVWPQPYNVMAPGTFKYRFPWTFPILFSPHDTKTLYTCANVVFRSTDMGHSWEAISPDLTRADAEKLAIISGGPITSDTSGAEIYGTIFTFRESLHQAGVFMSGSDDGRVHLSLDNGKTWKNVTPKALPEWSFVRTVEPSPHEEGTWYLAATRYKLNDFAPYIFVTRNNGKTWTQITEGIDTNDYVRVVRTDPGCKGLLFAGTEMGLYVSVNDGKQWQKWAGNLPITPIYDLKVKDDDLVLASHGRGFWMLDDLSALRECVAADPKGLGRPLGSSPRLFSAGLTYRVLPDLFAQYVGSEGKSYDMGLGISAISVAKKSETGHVERKYLDAGTGRDRGVIVYYALPESPIPNPQLLVRLEFLDPKGNLIRAYTPKPADYDTWDDKKKSLEIGPWMSVKPGLNRFVWNLKHAGAARVAGNKTATAADEGPLVSPGVYTVRLVVGEQTQTVEISIVNDPRSKTSLRDLQAQEKMLLAMRDKISDAHKAVNRLRELREQTQAWQRRMTSDEGRMTSDAEEMLGAACGEVIKKLDAIEDALILPGEQKDNYNLILRARLNEVVATLMTVVNSADAKPTKATQALFAEHSAAIDAEVAKLNEAVKTDVAALNALIAQKGLAAVG